MLQHFLALLASLIISINAEAHSPCPDLFQYVSQKAGQWNGDITLRSDSQLHGIWVRLIFDSVVKNISTKNDFGEFVQRDNFEYLFENRNYILNAGDSVKVPISVEYDGDETPKLIGFRLNAISVCPEESDGQQTWIDDKDVFLGDLNSKNYLSSLQKPREFPGCGTVPLYPDFLDNNTSREGQYPWNVFIYLKTDSYQKRICSGTLISSTHVITAAHCVSSSRLHPHVFEIRLGEHFTIKQNKGAQEARVLKIDVHPGYNSPNLNNDVAIITLENNALITDYVRAVCLWNDYAVEVLSRVVTGLCYDIDGRYIDVVSHAELREVPIETCSDKKPELVPFLSNKTQCLGFTKRNVVCVGESGSGVTYLDRSKRVWLLRGLITIGAGLQNNLVCDESNFIVMTDLTKHTKWIRSMIA